MNRASLNIGVTTSNLALGIELKTAISTHCGLECLYQEEHTQLIKRFAELVIADDDLPSFAKTRNPDTDILGKPLELYQAFMLGLKYKDSVREYLGNAPMCCFGTGNDKNKLVFSKNS